MRDFSLRTLCKLLEGFKKAGYEFVSFFDYLERPDVHPSVVILRHDVDRIPERSLRMATMEKSMGICGTYYFRSAKGLFPEKEVREIAESGHEIGYHYEDLQQCGGDVSDALATFQENLVQLRQTAPVKTICMHGSPMSKHDNRDMWKDRSYREFGIIGEPYFDIDFSKVMYLTDTGRKWDGSRVSIRDKVVSSQKSVVSREEGDRRQKTEDRREDENGKKKIEDKESKANKWPRLHSTQDIINALRNNELPDQIMLTIHPQRWTDEWRPWMWELVSQKVKNVVKYFIVKSRQ